MTAGHFRPHLQTTALISTTRAPAQAPMHQSLAELTSVKPHARMKEPVSPISRKCPQVTTPVVGSKTGKFDGKGLAYVDPHLHRMG
jgi:hypothetical protein